MADSHDRELLVAFGDWLYPRIGLEVWHREIDAFLASRQSPGEPIIDGEKQPMGQKTTESQKNNPPSHAEYHKQRAIGERTAHEEGEPAIERCSCGHANLSHRTDVNSGYCIEEGCDCRGWQATPPAPRVTFEVFADRLGELPTSIMAVPADYTPPAPFDESKRRNCRPAPQPVCRECGVPLRHENLRCADGCPCNSPRGVNHGLVPTNVCACVACDPEETGSVRTLPKPTAPPAPQRK